MIYIVDFGLPSKTEGMLYAVTFKNGCSEKKKPLGATKKST